MVLYAVYQMDMKKKLEMQNVTTKKLTAEILTQAYLSPDIVYQAIHTRFHAEGVLAW
jgi:hypothetical protein